jgi:hypothetical protein
MENKIHGRSKKVNRKIGGREEVIRMSRQSFRSCVLRCRLCIVALLLVGGIACHKVERNNPLDPALTPAVTLTSVLFDTTAGTVTLIWTPYEGDQPFAAYKVFRREVKLVDAVTLTVIQEVTQTTFVDTTLQPNTGEVVYWVSVVNTTGLENPSQEEQVSGYGAGPVGVPDVKVDAQAGTVTVRWQQYRGSRFVAYRVERSQVGAAAFESLGQPVTAVEETVFVDRDVPSNTTVLYRVVVEAAGRVWPSPPSREVRLGVSGVELLEVGVTMFRRGQCGYGGVAIGDTGLSPTG